MSPDNYIDWTWDSTSSNSWSISTTLPARKKNVPRAYVGKKALAKKASPKKYGAFITPDHTEIYSGTNIFTRNTQQSMNVMMKQAPRNCGVLPAVVRSFSPDMKQWLIERTPFVAHMAWHDKNNHDHYHFEIPIPWTMYHVVLGDTYQIERVAVWGLDAQVFADDDKLYQLPLPNLHGNGNVCFGEVDLHDQVGQLGPNPQLGKVLSIAINAYWSSAYNSDIEDWCHVLPEEINPGYTNNHMEKVFEKWEALSMQEVLKLKWTESTAKLTTLLYEELVKVDYPKTAEALNAYLTFVGMKQ